MTQWWGGRPFSRARRQNWRLSIPASSFLGWRNRVPSGLFSGLRAYGKLVLESIPATSSSRVRPLSVREHDLPTLDLKLKGEGPSLWKHTSSFHFLLHPKVHRMSPQILDDQETGIIQMCEEAMSITNTESGAPFRLTELGNHYLYQVSPLTHSLMQMSTTVWELKHEVWSSNPSSTT